MIYSRVLLPSRGHAYKGLRAAGLIFLTIAAYEHYAQINLCHELNTKAWLRQVETRWVVVAESSSLDSGFLI
jgi:hypothetical protein